MDKEMFPITSPAVFASAANESCLRKDRSFVGRLFERAARYMLRAELAKKDSQITLLQEELMEKEAALAASISKAEQAEARSTQDQLTRLYNRFGLNAGLYHLASNAARYGRPISLIAFDIDFFKHVNDTFGHSGGDQVLVAMADLLRNIVRGGDLVARMGGEEFIVAIDSNEAIAEAVAVKIRKAIEQELSDNSRTVTVSVGVFTFDPKPLFLPQAHEKAAARAQKMAEFIKLPLIAEAMEKVDAASYFAKNEGRNCIAVPGPHGFAVIERGAPRSPVSRAAPAEVLVPAVRG